MTEQKKKEIGIRKVLGAKVSSILGLLSRDFLKWVALANVLAWPVSYILARQLLQNYAYRIGISADVFIMSGFISLTIALLTITFQTFITPEEMEYKIDLTKYPSFCTGKRAGDLLHQLVFKWKE